METLVRLCADLAGGAIKIVDLTHTLSPEFPVLVLPPELGQCAPFRIEEVSRYDERGPAWYWNNISMSEHAGTHFDAPVHWVTGKDLPANAVDTIPPQRLVAPAVVLDFSAQSAADEDFLLTVPHVKEWESRHGKIGADHWVLFRTDWYRRAGSASFLNLREDGAHSPGPSAEAMKFFAQERGVVGFGTETVGTDAGQGGHLSPPYPAHHYMHGAGRYGLQCLANLDQLPPRGSVIITAPLKIRDGSGSPLRVLAMVAGG